jgi:Protein of unknown function (DUF1565)
MPHRWMSLAMVSGVVAGCGGSAGSLLLSNNDGLPDSGAGAEGSTDAGGPNGHSDADSMVDATSPSGATDGASEASSMKTGDGSPSADARAEGGPTTSNCPAITESGGAFVDMHGTDDTGHGGGSGTCAYKTITYALAHFDRTIAVNNGTYTAATGEQFPLVMTGRQTLSCADSTTTLIEGENDYQNTRATIVIDGTSNVITHCGIVGDDTTGACVLVKSAGTGDGHEIELSEAQKCGDAAYRIEQSGVLLQGSWGHDSVHGVVWAGGNDLTGKLANNLFWNNSAQDITCTAADDGVTGNGNDDSYNNPVTCSVCDDCAGFAAP